MNLKPQDLVVALELTDPASRDRTQSQLAGALCLSQSEIAKSLRRGVRSHLLVADSDSGRPRPVRRALVEFIAHGIRYAFPPDRGGLVRGVPTAHAAAPLKAELLAGDEPPPVWPWAEGEVRGESFSPLYPRVPAAAIADPSLHEMLALVDAIRGGRARERDLALGHLKQRLRSR